MRRTLKYAAMTKDEGNAADGLSSSAFKGMGFSSPGYRHLEWIRPLNSFLTPE
jgi:hypothetical protein